MSPGVDCGVRNAEFRSYGAVAAQRSDDVECGSHSKTLRKAEGFVNSRSDMRDRRKPECARTPNLVLTTAEILAALDKRKVKRARIAEALGIAPSRVTELFKGDRRLYHEEAIALCEAFELDCEPEPAAVELSEQAATVMALHAASALGQRIDPQNPVLQELARDFGAFARFASDPKVAESLDAMSAWLAGRSSIPRQDPKTA